MHTYGLLSKHQDNCQLELIGERNVRVQVTISGIWQSRSPFHGPDTSLSKLRQCKPDSGCLKYFAATCCTNTPQKSHLKGKASEYHIFGEKQRWMEFSSGTSYKNHRPSLVTPSFCVLTDVYIFFYIRPGAIWRQRLSLIYFWVEYILLWSICLWKYQERYDQWINLGFL